MSNDSAPTSIKADEYVASLQSRLGRRSDELEEIHMEAAIDAELAELAELTATITEASHANPAVVAAQQATDKDEPKIFDDYVNPNSVANCLSPYVPTKAERIAAFCSFTNLKTDDVLLDLGCGDGRVCIAAATLTGCRTIGIDVSPPCIAMAKEVAKEEGMDENRCFFFEADATVDPDLLLADSSPLSKLLRSVTVVFLFTYPTLLQSLVPLLDQLTKDGRVRAVVTLTYHLSDEIERTESEHDFQLYSRIQKPRS